MVASTAICSLTTCGHGRPRLGAAELERALVEDVARRGRGRGHLPVLEPHGVREPRLVDRAQPGLQRDVERLRAWPRGRRRRRARGTATLPVNSARVSPRPGFTRRVEAGRREWFAPGVPGSGGNVSCTLSRPSAPSASIRRAPAPMSMHVRGDLPALRARVACQLDQRLAVISACSSVSPSARVLQVHVAAAERLQRAGGASSASVIRELPRSSSVSMSFLVVAEMGDRRVGLDASGRRAESCTRARSACTSRGARTSAAAGGDVGAAGACSHRGRCARPPDRGSSARRGSCS